MEIKFNIPFICPDSIAPHLERVFAGEYDVKAYFYGAKILDLGANCGSFALWAAHRFPGSEIHSYEPHPETFKFLEKNAEGYPNVKCYNWGIGTPGWRPLGVGRNNCGENSFHKIENNPNPLGVHCEVKDPLTLPEADILKMDIEGCEWEVLEPLLAAGRKFKLILLEYHNEGLRRKIDEALSEYHLIGSEVQNICGRGVVKYLHKEYAV